MSGKPFVSIINPIRNVGRTIEKCLQSLIELDYPRESLEFIFADGDSTDSTVKIIEDWKKRYPQVVIVSVPNCKSPGQARNAALKIARGDYILFTGGDCIVRKDWVDKILEAFSKDKKIEIGQPYLKDAKVKAIVLKQDKADKVISFKYRRRKSSHWKKGHRRLITRLKIEDISA